MPSLSRRRAVLAAVGAAAVTSSANATWSILIANTRTGEIALASATCLQRIDLREETPVLILGVGGKNFAAGGHMGMDAGYAIIAAEEEGGKGILKLRIWRDKNWLNRTGAQDMFAEDIEAVFKEAEQSSDVYEWKGEEERTTAVKQMSLDLSEDVQVLMK